MGFFGVKLTNGSDLKNLNEAFRMLGISHHPLKDGIREPMHLSSRRKKKLRT
jgi:hypothetical protein